MRPPLLFDEHVPVALADALRTQGVDVLHLVDTDLRGAADDEVLSEAARLGRVLVSFNMRDFHQLAKVWADEGRGHTGVILVATPRGIGELVRRLVGKLDEYADIGLRDAVLFV